MQNFEHLRIKGANIFKMYLIIREAKNYEIEEV